jgi:mono/diheme cytochrome c family protein
MREHRREGKPQDGSRLRSGRGLIGALLVAAWCTGGASQAAAADGAALFEAKCAACHSVGEGPRVGPDLKGVVARRGVEWATLAIVDPAKAGLGPNMPKLGLSPAEAQAINAFLDGRSAEAGQAPPAQAAKEAAPEPTAAEIEKGRGLFEGSVRFAKGGPACNACHHVNHEAVTGGGILASDLTASFSRAGAEGLAAIVASAPFPVMQIAYEGREVTAEEARALAGFLQRVDAQSASQKPASYGGRLLIGGVIGVVVLAGLFSLLGSGRKKRSVNQDIYDRQLGAE